MDGGDALLLARAQFGLNIAFHILFPTLTIGLAWLLVYFRMRFARSGDKDWLTAFKVWTKVFALTFAMGVVSGITMSFQFGTNWPGFMNKVGNIAGPLLGYEVLTAFFLEAGFLGIMLFGHGKVSEKVHLAATALVAFGTTLSAFWILALNSWMQTPTGYRIDADGAYHAASWLAVIFNPSFPYRFTHMMLASTLTVAFLEHQPQKIAALEAVWETERGASLRLFAWPSEKDRANHFEIAVPRLGSWVLTHSADGEVKGLNEFRDHPPVAPLFFAFRIMVGVGLLMLVAAWAGVWMYRRARWDAQALPRRFLQLLAAMTFAGWLATVSGWYITEIGRQPFIVFGLVRTADVVSKTPAPMIAVTLSLYVTLYIALVIAYVTVLKYMAEKPEEVLAAQAEERSVTPPGVATAPSAVAGPSS